MKLPLYLDCNASTPVLPELAQLLLLHCQQQQGNAQAEHPWGGGMRRLVEQAAAELAQVAQTPPEGVIFTSGATEANQLATLGLAAYGAWLQRQGRQPHAISSVIEHASVLEPLKQLQQQGWGLDLLPCDQNGLVMVEQLRDLLRPETVLLSLMAVNNETGVVQPLERVAQLMAEHSAWWHCDAAQGFARVNLPTRIDLISLSGHKIYAPIGVGALLLRPRCSRIPGRLLPPRPWQVDVASPWPPLSPLFWGGGQQGGLRSGSLPAPLIHTLGRAAQLQQQYRCQWRERNLYLRQGWLDILTPLGAEWHGDSACSLEHVLNFSLPYLNADTLLFHCRDLFAAGRGAACSEGGESRVLQAMGRSQEQLRGAVRLSWCHFSPTPPWQEISQRLGQLCRSTIPP